MNKYNILNCRWHTRTHGLYCALFDTLSLQTFSSTLNLKSVISISAPKSSKIVLISAAIYKFKRAYCIIRRNQSSYAVVFSVLSQTFQKQSLRKLIKFYLLRASASASLLSDIVFYCRPEAVWYMDDVYIHYSVTFPRTADWVNVKELPEIQINIKVARLFVEKFEQLSILQWLINFFLNIHHIGKNLFINKNIFLSFVVDYLGAIMHNSLNV